jgi:hypothetical protein
MRACPKCLHSFIRINTHFTRFPSHDPNNFAERSDDDDDNDEEAPSSINEQNALSSRRLPGTILGASHRRRSPETNGDSTFPLLDFPVQEEDVNSESTYPADAATHQHGEAPIVSTLVVRSGRNPAGFRIPVPVPEILTGTPFRSGIIFELCAPSVRPEFRSRRLRVALVQIGLFSGSCRFLVALVL